jgi:hypothetical protein
MSMYEKKREQKTALIPSLEPDILENKEQSDEKKYNEMMKPITYTSEYDK